LISVAFVDEQRSHDVCVTLLALVDEIATIVVAPGTLADDLFLIDIIDSGVQNGNPGFTEDEASETDEKREDDHRERDSIETEPA
jgi:hypothetical protein